MKFHRRSAGASPIDLTPMLDVVFLLLVFFMVTSTFDRVRTVRIDLPDVNAGQGRPDRRSTRVELASDGALVVDGATARIGDLKMHLKAAKNVTLGADKGVSHGRFMKVLTELQQLGLDAVVVEVDEAPSAEDPR